MRGHIITDIVKNKLKNRSGINRTVALLVVIAVVLAAVAILIPTLKYYRDQSRRINCAAALDSAYRQYVDGYLYKGKPLTKDEAKEIITSAMLGWDDLCPGGGNVYIVEDTDKPGSVFRLVCGMHGEDKKELTRLNAKYVLDTVREKVAEAQKNGDEYPESVTLTLNGEELTARLTDEATGLRRGTYTSPGFEGTVAFYGIVGHSDFGADSGMEEGEIFYFSFADENYCANWNYRQSWTGDSYK